MAHLLALTIVYHTISMSFVTGQTIATLMAITSNFFLNNFLTYHAMCLWGWGLLCGWISFMLACSVGAIVNVDIATYLSFWIISAVAGILVGAVWNYAATIFYTWHKR